MSINTYSYWLSTHLGNSENEVRKLLADKSALYFLMTWSIFESKCFNGYCKIEKIDKFADNLYKTIEFENLTLSTQHFHERYQCDELFDNLMHKQKCSRMIAVLEKPFNEARREDLIYFIVIVIYRYRNNIFHGNKGVKSWLKYREQIEHCIAAMQVMVSHTESTTQSTKTMNL